MTIPATQTDPAARSSAPATEETILEEVAALLRDIIGEEYVLDLEIGMDTSFADLELESIEFVTLADRLTATYGAKVDFVGFLSVKDVDQVINMKVGEVVEYIVGALVASGG
jgi:acyl carrier protein